MQVQVNKTKNTHLEHFNSIQNIIEFIEKNLSPFEILPLCHLSTTMDDHVEDAESQSFSHEELMQLTNSALSELLPNDPVLRDLPHEVTLEEVNAQVALQFGRSMTVYVVRGDGEELPIVVPQGTATVLDLKHALKRYMTLRLMRQKNTLKLSWRHIWRTHWLSFDSQPLKEDRKLLSNYSIHNRSRVAFIRRLRERRK